jgi:hypothetical protein
MKINVFGWMVRIIVVLSLAAGSGALAQAPSPRHFSGIISDYTPLSASASPTGPWELRGKWSLHVKGDSGKADFSAIIVMELSDYWVLKTNADPTNSGDRSQHTHHITLTDAVVNYDASVCPANSPATNPTGIVLTTDPNTVLKITANGGPAPFEIKGPSTLQVCITGGTEVQNSNLSLVFGGAAAGHFGSQAIHGVVSFPRHANESDSSQQ